MIWHYDKDGNPMSLEEWIAFQKGWALNEWFDYKRVAETWVGKIWISTVWIGLDYNFSRSGPPLIFETMVFGGVMDQEAWRWPTEEAAQKGHDEIVTMVRLSRQLMTHGQKKHERDQYRERNKGRMARFFK